MAGFVTMPQVLSVIGQAPNQHGRKTAIENLRAVKSMFPMFGMNGKMPAQMQEMVEKVMKDGPGAMLSNPMGALGGMAEGKIGDIAGKLGIDVGGAGPMLSALTGPGGMQAAVSKLVGTAGSLAGAGGTGTFDLMSVVGHSGLAGLGNIPAAMGMDRVVGPVFAGGPMQAALDTLDRIASVVEQSGTPGFSGDVNAFLGDVLGHTAELNAIVDASNEALTLGLQATLSVGSFAVLADGLDPTRTDNPLAEFFAAVVTPEAQSAIALHHEQMAAEAPLRSGRNADGSIPGTENPIDEEEDL